MAKENPCNGTVALCLGLLGLRNNYYRTGFYERNGIQRISYDEDTFRRFLSDYTCELNMAAKEAGTYDQDTLEASYWGYAFCRQSENSAVRYSGFLSLLPYVFLNARNLLTQEEFNAWTMTLCEEAKEDFIALQAFWKGKRIAWISDTQKWMQNLMLKSNGVSSRVSDYLGVVAILITMDSLLKSDQRHPSPL